MTDQNTIRSGQPEPTPEKPPEDVSKSENPPPPPPIPAPNKPGFIAFSEMDESSGTKHYTDSAKQAPQPVPSENPPSGTDC